MAISWFIRKAAILWRESDRGAYHVTSWNLFGSATADPNAGPQCTAQASSYPCPPECGQCDRCGWASCYDDVGYFQKLLDEVETNYRVDSSRIYALGMSNGGMMTLRLGCDLSQRFAAIAPIGGQMPQGYACGPDSYLPMIHLSGAKDNTVRVDGQPAADGFIYVSVADTAARWANDLSCKAGPAAWSSPATKAAGLVCQAYEDCTGPGRAVVHCTDPEGEHRWPASRPGGPWPICVTRQQADMKEQPGCAPRQGTGPHLGMDVIWEFLSQHTRHHQAR